MGMKEKASITDIKNTIAEVAMNIESRVSYDELNRAMASKASKEDLSDVNHKKVTFEEMK